jgi:hypothetical protein
MLHVVRDFAIGECGEDYNLYIEVMGVAVRMITLHNWPHDANRERWCCCSLADTKACTLIGCPL